MTQPLERISSQNHAFNCPGYMFANSIPARLVAMRIRMSLPWAWPHHARMRGPYHAHAHGYDMRRVEL